MRTHEDDVCKRPVTFRPRIRVVTRTEHYQMDSNGVWVLQFATTKDEVTER